MAKEKSNVKLVPAVGYLRKSSPDNKDAKGQVRADQEKSITIQRNEMIARAEGKYDIIRWYVDENVPGWKPRAKKPDYFRMLNDAQTKHDFQAILCDAPDRFSRASEKDSLRELWAFRDAGVEYIDTASHGVIQAEDPLQIMHFVMLAHAAHQYVLGNARKIARKRLLYSQEGRRSGGRPPYGMDHADKKHLTLKPGKPEEVKVVKWLYKEFGSGRRSLAGLVSELNKKKIPSPTGKAWYTSVVGSLLQRRAYVGDLIHGQSHGSLFTSNAKGEIVDAQKANLSDGPTYIKRNVHKGIVSRQLFDKVQQRLDKRRSGKMKPRDRRPALAHVLYCQHCGRPMYRAQGKGRPTAQWRCSSNVMQGKGSCGHYSIPEDVILPFICELVGEELEKLGKTLQTQMPVQQTQDPTEAQRRQAEQLKRKIDTATRNLSLCDDNRTRADLNKLVSAMRDELETLEAAKAQDWDSESELRYLEELVGWWSDFRKSAVEIPVSGKSLKAAKRISDAASPDKRRGLKRPLHQDDDKQWWLRVDTAHLNEALLSLGCRVELRWESRAAGSRLKHTLVSGYFRMGHREGFIPQHILNGSLQRQVQTIFPLLSKIDRVFSAEELIAAA